MDMTGNGYRHMNANGTKQSKSKYVGNVGAEGFESALNRKTMEDSDNDENIWDKNDQICGNDIKCTGQC